MAYLKPSKVQATNQTSLRFTPTLKPSNPNSQTVTSKPSALMPRRNHPQSQTSAAWRTYTGRTSSYNSKRDPVRNRKIRRVGNPKSRRPGPCRDLAKPECRLLASFSQSLPQQIRICSCTDSTSRCKIPQASYSVSRWKRLEMWR